MFQRKDVCGPKARMGLSFTAKEAHFFDEDDQLAKGLKHYESLFDHCDPEKTRIYMDATPKHQLHPQRVHQFYKEAGMEKTVKTLREPVSRDMSWYNHLLRESNKSQPPEWAQEVFHNLQNSTVKTFEDYAMQNIAPLIHGKNPTHRGLYAHWLKQWFKLFDRQQIFIASYDDLRSDPADFLQRLLVFLDLPAPKKDHLPYSNGKKARNAQAIPCKVQKQFAKEFEIPNEQLYHLLKTNPGPAMDKRLTFNARKCERSSVVKSRSFAPLPLARLYSLVAQNLDVAKLLHCVTTSNWR